MVTELLQKYIWLVQTFVRAGEYGLDLNEICNKWEDRFDTPYSRRTFNNHRDAVLSVFGIMIECNRSTNRYFIKYTEDVADENAENAWLINTFTVNNLLRLSKDRLSGRIAVEDIPSGHMFLTGVMEAMDESHEIIITYQKYTKTESESCLKRSDLVAQLVTVKRKTGLESEGIATAQTAWNHTCSKELVPDFIYGLMSAIDFESVLTCITGTAYDHPPAVPLSLIICVEAKIRSRSKSENFDRNPFCLRALKSYFTPGIGSIDDFHIISFPLGAYPLIVLGDIRGVHNQKIFLRLELLIYEKIVNNGSVGIQKHTIEDLSIWNAGHIVGEDMVDKLFRIRSAYEYLTHVGHIEHSGLVTDRIVFFSYRRILNRHDEASERTHLSS